MTDAEIAHALKPQYPKGPHWKKALDVTEQGLLLKKKLSLLFSGFSSASAKNLAPGITFTHCPL